MRGQTGRLLPTAYPRRARRVTEEPVQEQRASSNDHHLVASSDKPGQPEHVVRVNKNILPESSRPREVEDVEWDLAAFTAPVVEAAEQPAHSGCEGGRCQPQLRDRADEETPSFDALLLGSGHVFLQNAANKVLKYETLHVPSGL